MVASAGLLLAVAVAAALAAAPAAGLDAVLATDSGLLLQREPFGASPAATPAGSGGWSGETKSVSCDLNGDGFVDVALYNTTSIAAPEVAVYTNDGSGSFTGPQTFSLTLPGPPAGSAFACNDIDLDGDLDLFVMTRGGAWVLDNLGGGVLNVTQPIDAPVLDPVDARLADMTGDGLLDIAVLATTASFLLYTNAGNGAFTPPSSALISSGISPAATLAMGHFNGDDLIDVAISVGGIARQVRVFFNSGSPSSPDYSTTPTSLAGPLSVLLAADLSNNSMALGLAGSNGDGSAVLFANNGTGTFTSATVATGLTNFVLTRAVPVSGAVRVIGFNPGSSNEYGSVALPSTFAPGTSPLGTLAGIAVSDFTNNVCACSCTGAGRPCGNVVENGAVLAYCPNVCFGTTGTTATTATTATTGTTATTATTGTTTGTTATTGTTTGGTGNTTTGGNATMTANATGTTGAATTGTGATPSSPPPPSPSPATDFAAGPATASAVVLAAAVAIAATA